jgi:hypothetical protein
MNAKIFACLARDCNPDDKDKMISLREAGPLLIQLLEAQRREEELVAFPLIETVADAVLAVAQRNRRCLIWPMGPAAERIVGVLEVRSHGAVDVSAWNTPVSNRAILLFGTVAASPLELQTAAERLLSRGAAEVHACAVDVPGAEEVDTFTSFERLELGEPLPYSFDSAA